MSKEEPRGAPRPLRRALRRTALWAVYATFLWCVLECGAWVVLRRLTGGTPIAEMLAQVLGEAEPRAQTQDGPSVPPFVRAESLHPYLGFMPRGLPNDVPENVFLIHDDKCYGPRSPLFSSDPSDLVVGISGGSVAAFFSRQGGSQRLTQLLAGLEAYRGRRARFVVLAYGGVKQPQQLMALNFVLAIGGRLDLLINLDGFNEIALHEDDNEIQGIAPIYPRAWYHRVSDLASGPLLGERRYLERRRGSRAQELHDSLFSRSNVRRLVWALENRSILAKIEALEQEQRSIKPGKRIDLPTSGPRTRAQGQSGRLAELAAIWERCSIQMSHDCAANGIAYYHFLQPNQYVEGSKPLSRDELATAYLPDRAYAQMVPLGYPLVRAGGERLAAAGVRFHDLTDVFKDVDATIYRDTCCHVNELGNHLLAESIAMAIASWGR